MRARLLSLAALFALGACAAGGPPAPTGLAYELPATPSATYVVGDTSIIDIDAGGQMLQSRVTLDGTYDLAFERAPDGLRVTMNVASYHASMTQPMAGPVTYDGSGIGGPVVFALDRRGVVTLEATPELGGQAQQFFQPLSTAMTFFPRLPGRAVDVGESWTDTIRYEGTEGQGEVTVVQVVTYTAAGDTVVDGRNLARFTFTGTAESEASGSMGGVDFSQSATGDVEGHVLWDFRAGMMVEHFTASTAEGSMDVSMAPFPLSMQATQRRTVRLAAGM